MNRTNSLKFGGVGIAVVLAIVLAAGPAMAWHAKGHRLATLEAIAALDRADMPAFFIAGAPMIAHCAPEPDSFCKYAAEPQVRDAEAPEHYFDIEKLDGDPPPALRYDFLALCAKKGLDPRKVGLLPYAVTECTQRLAVAFSEYRQWPGNPYIQQECLMYAGILSHYAEDLCQPLHTTIHYDGRAKADGSCPHTGFHPKVDALLGKLPADPNSPPAGLRPAAFDDLMGAVLAEFAASHNLVEPLYALEAQVPAVLDPLDANSPVGRFAEERLRACARFTASLYLTAWKESQKLQVPQWQQREGADGRQANKDSNVPAR